MSPVCVRQRTERDGVPCPVDAQGTPFSGRFNLRARTNMPRYITPKYKVVHLKHHSKFRAQQEKAAPADPTSGAAAAAPARPSGKADVQQVSAASGRWALPRGARAALRDTGRGAAAEEGEASEDKRAEIRN